jgi:hypothetical protein
MVADFHGFRFLQLVFDLGIPWIGFGGRFADPGNKPPQSGKEQKTHAQPGHHLIWIVGPKHETPWQFLT